MSSIKCWVCDSNRYIDCGDPFNSRLLSESLLMECPPPKEGIGACIKAKVECNYFENIFCANFSVTKNEKIVILWLRYNLNFFSNFSDGYRLPVLFKWNYTKYRQFRVSFVFVQTCIYRRQCWPYWLRSGYLWTLFWWGWLQWSFRIWTNCFAYCCSSDAHENFIVLKFFVQI